MAARRQLTLLSLPRTQPPARPCKLVMCDDDIRLHRISGCTNGGTRRASSLYSITAPVRTLPLGLCVFGAWLAVLTWSFGSSLANFSGVDVAFVSASHGSVVSRREREREREKEGERERGTLYVP